MPESRFQSSATDAGFTLIELLIVVAIIAILAAIAIPQFSSYRERAVRSSILLDARNAMTQEEAYFVDARTYVVVPATAGRAIVTVGPSNFIISDGNTLSVGAGGSGILSSYVVTVVNSNSGALYGTYTIDNRGSCSWSAGAAC